MGPFFYLDSPSFYKTCVGIVNNKKVAFYNAHAWHVDYPYSVLTLFPFLLLIWLYKTGIEEGEMKLIDNNSSQRPA